MGVIEGAPGCDHECRMIRPLKGTSDEWREAIESGTSRWLAGVKTEIKPDQNGQIAFGEPLAVSDVDTVAGVMQEINDNEAD
jgi:hypothetical protein